MKEKCDYCGKRHKTEECPRKEYIKELVIFRLKTLPENLRLSIG